MASARAYTHAGRETPARNAALQSLVTHFEEYTAGESSNKAAIQEELEHKERMRQLEAMAVGYKSPFISSDSGH